MKEILDRLDQQDSRLEALARRLGMFEKRIEKMEEALEKAIEHIVTVVVPSAPPEEPKLRGFPEPPRVGL